MPSAPSYGKGGHLAIAATSISDVLQDKYETTWTLAEPCARDHLALEIAGQEGRASRASRDRRPSRPFAFPLLGTHPPPHRDHEDSLVSYIPSAQ